VKAPRTPWGAPDMQGIWSSNTITPLVRPAKYAGREFLTTKRWLPKCRTGAGGRAAPARTARQGGRLDARPEEAARVVGAYQSEWSPAGRNYVARSAHRSSWIRPTAGSAGDAEGQKRADTGRWRTAYEHVKFMDTLRADGPEDRNDPERAAPCSYRASIFSASSPGIVQTSDSRVDLLRRPRRRQLSHDPAGQPSASSATIRQWLGDSRGVGRRHAGRRDDELLEQTNFFGATENLHLVERYTRVGQT